MNIQLIARPTQETNISLLNKKPHTIDNEYIIDFSQPSSNRTKASITLRELQFHIKNIEIKIHISTYLDIKPDSLILYSKDNQGSVTQLNDKDPFIIPKINSVKDPLFSSPVINRFNSSSRSKKRAVVYFSLSYEIQRVMINLFNKHIEKMIFNVSPYCSVYLLKHMISQKTSLTISKENQILYSTGLLSPSVDIKASENKHLDKKDLLQKTYAFKSSTSHKLKDETTLHQIIEYYSNNKGNNNISNPIIDIILAEKQKDKYQIGLDFSFNIMKTSNKIEYDSSAPVYREVSDGLNLFSYCHNSKCTINKEMFSVNIGYGQYDIIQLCEQIKCPKCKDKTMHEVKNIGMINSQWKYRGILNGQSLSACEGDGFTIDQKLYVLSEISIVQQFNTLIIDIKPYSNKMKETKVTNINDDQSITFDDLDEIDLYTPNEERFNKIIEYNHIRHKEPIKVDINDNINSIRVKEIGPEIFIDTIAKEVCTGCNNIPTADICILF